MAQGSTETENETHAWGCSAARERDPSASSQVSVAEDARFELARGCPQQRFPSVRLSVHGRPCPSVTWDDRDRWVSADAREFQRMRLRMRLRLERED
jgi:hypothetical protein